MDVSNLEENLYGKREILNKVIEDLGELEAGIEEKANALE
jgi:hypothetical protein